MKIEKSEERKKSDYKIALAGNPNVGKSTVFNELTGMHQHTGNWAGKTVANAFGYCKSGKRTYYIADVPGTYSYSAGSAEEEVARDYICFEENDAVIVVCDATCLERNMNLILQTLEITEKVVVCINLIDEAEKKSIEIDTALLKKRLGVPIIKTDARKGNGVKELLSATTHISNSNVFRVTYSEKLEEYIEKICKRLEIMGVSSVKRFFAIRILCEDKSFLSAFEKKCGICADEDEEIKKIIELAKKEFSEKMIEDVVAETIVKEAEEICRNAVKGNCIGYGRKDKRLDKVFTGRVSGMCIMFMFLLCVFWLTLEGANVISEYLSVFLGAFERPLSDFLHWTGIPAAIVTPLTEGVWRLVAWVISVMLPPMAIFFPLFTLLEDFGYLPRIAFNLDGIFKKCSACGKQGLTMCMGFGCNAVGVMGCRIIDSPRERLIAMLTNSFVPCNGRFPALIALITIFFAGTSKTILSSVASAGILTGIIAVGIAATFLSSKLLSLTILRGVPSFFTLELPSYRRPQLGKIFVRSILDRTLFVVGRAIKVAAPAGLIIWLMANITVDGKTIFAVFAEFLDPVGAIFGLDGVILIAFVLSLPANEILLPLIIMIYASSNTLGEVGSIYSLAEILKQNGWDTIQAMCVMFFSLMHWPCATTLMTIKKESGSMKWTFVAFLLPTLFGVVSCFIFNLIARALL